MNRNVIPNALVLAVLLLAPISANAAFWIINDTLQNGDEGALGYGDNSAGTSPTLGFVGLFTNGGSGGGNFAIYAQGIAPSNDYACYGLTAASDTCTNTSGTTIWNPNPAVFSGSINDDLSFMDLSWTGQVGTEVPFGVGESLFVSGINSGSYDASGNISGGVDLGAGYDADGFFCWNNPNNGLPGEPDFCGNGTGVTTTAPPGGGQTKANQELSAGLTGFGGFTDNMDGTITIDLWDSTYTDCINDSGCTPGANSEDVFVQWRVNATKVVPIPAAVWLFGSALGLLGWVRRKAT
jgi:hypothetical protein